MFGEFEEESLRFIAEIPCRVLFVSLPDPVRLSDPAHWLDGLADGECSGFVDACHLVRWLKRHG